MYKLLIYLSLVLLFSSCQSKKKADMIFYNGIIYSVDKNFSVAEAFAVNEGKIIGVGTSKDMLNEFDAKEIVDFEGKPVYPGFIDAHCHFYQYATDLQKVNLIGTKSFDDVVQKVVE